MTDLTLRELVARYDQDVLDHLDHDATIPIANTSARQGDVMVLSTRLRATSMVPSAPVPTDGIDVVRGQFGGNTHRLIADGDVRYESTDGGVDGLELGVMLVTEGATAWFVHREHGAVGFAPGSYVVLRQRELRSGAAALIMD